MRISDWSSDVCSSDLFVRHVAPYDVPIKAGVAKHAVIAAFVRCGLDRTDPHVLRHSIASRLLADGTPMKHIADVLRHRSLDTSKIYTKIDLRRLSAVAMPWPRAEERRVGKECVSRCRSRWSPYH